MKTLVDVKTPSSICKSRRFVVTYKNKEIKDHLKKLREIKRDLKKNPIGTPLRKNDRNYKGTVRGRSRQVDGSN